MIRFIKRLSLRPKILGGFGLILLLLVAAAVVCNTFIHEMESDVDSIVNYKTHELVDAANVNLYVTMVNANVRGYLLTGDEDQKQRTLDRMASLEEAKKRVVEDLQAQGNEEGFADYKVGARRHECLCKHENR